MFTNVLLLNLLTITTQIRTQGRLDSVRIDTEVVEMHDVALTTAAALGVFKSSINFLPKKCKIRNKIFNINFSFFRNFLKRKFQIL